MKRKKKRQERNVGVIALTESSGQSDSIGVEKKSPAIELEPTSEETVIQSDTVFQIRDTADVTRNWLGMIEASKRRRRTEYEEWSRSARELSPLKRAEAWLRFVSEHMEDYGEQESVVYLRSRGYDCSPQIEEIAASWEQAAEQAINACARGSACWDPKTSKTEWRGGMSVAEASDIEDRSVWHLSDFWGESGDQLLSLDACMVRTTEWCEIKGFDSWWKRLALREAYSIIRHGADPEVVIQWLFNFTRSDLALTIMDLEHALRVVQLQDGQFPWVLIKHYPMESERDAYRECDCVAYAGALAFCTGRLKGAPASKTDLILPAIACLKKQQREDGSWPWWVDDNAGSIKATAICLHALAVTKAPSVARMTRAAVSWLWDQQHKDGYWIEDSCPDAAYLSVLVLDAIDASQGKTKVTFCRTGSSLGV